MKHGKGSQQDHSYRNTAAEKGGGYGWDGLGLGNAVMFYTATFPMRKQRQKPMADLRRGKPQLELLRRHLSGHLHLVE